MEAGLSMRWLVALFFVFTLQLAAANIKLYTTDGDYQLVREYQVEGDRVKFYSVERSEWEEVPASMVDLKRTTAESAAVKEVLDRQAKELDDEKVAARAEKAETARIPEEFGVYRIENDTVRVFKLAEVSVHTSKGRSIMARLSPLPIIEGKATVEVAGEKSANVVHEDRPEFLLRLEKRESFGIIKLTPQKGVRIAEHLSILPVVNETEEERASVEIFTKQLSDDGLYKIWPQEPLSKGEYAVIEYTEGKVEMRIWDFRIE
jgi:hypothetical protein